MLLIGLNPFKNASNENNVIKLAFFYFHLFLPLWRQANSIGLICISCKHYTTSTAVSVSFSPYRALCVHAGLCKTHYTIFFPSVTIFFRISCFFQILSFLYIFDSSSLTKSKDSPFNFPVSSCM